MYRKFRPDNLFDGQSFLPKGSVLVTNEEGTVMDILLNDPSLPDQYPEVESFEGTIAPGFVNTHCHLELSFLAGQIPAKTGMVDFLLAVIRAERPPLSAIIEAAENAEDSMMMNGIVAVGDICNTSATLSVKRKANIYYHNFIEALGFEPREAGNRFEKAVAVFRDFAGNYPFPMEQNSIVPHAPYSVSKELMHKIFSFPGNRLLSIHHQEDEAEISFLMNGEGGFHRLYERLGIDSKGYNAPGVSSIQYILPAMFRNQALILVHNTTTRNEDLHELMEMENKGLQYWLCLCPNANLYINNKLPDINLIRSFTDRITIGTDSLASNRQLNILEELKSIHQQFAGIPVSELLRWSTLNGARALGIDNEVGSFAKGKQPGIVWIKGLSPEKLDPAAISRRIL